MYKEKTSCRSVGAGLGEASAGSSMRISHATKSAACGHMAALANRRFALVFVLWLALPAIQGPRAESPALVAGMPYDLELDNGSILRGAVFRERLKESDFFDVAGIGERLQIRNYRVVRSQQRRAWQATAGLGALRTLDQPSLGFGLALQFEIQGAVSLWAAAPPMVPQMAARAGFSRLSGDRAILSGPEISAGLLWLIPLERQRRHYFRVSAFAGSGFYELLNRNIDTTYAQTTFLSSAQLGYLYRAGTWGYALHYTHTYFYDTNYPLHAGGVAFTVTYFSEEK